MGPKISWSPHLVHVDKITGPPPIAQGMHVLKDDIVDDPRGIFRGRINVILVNEPIGARFTVEQDVWNPERALPRRSCDCLSASQKQTGG